MYQFLTTAPYPAGIPHGWSDDDEAVPLTPSTVDEDVDIDTSSTSSVSGESWARGIFDERRQPADSRGAEGQPSKGASAAAAAGAGSAPPSYAESGFGARSVPVAQHLGAKELRAVSDFRPGAGSPAVSIATGSIGPAEIGAGGSAAVAAVATVAEAPPPAAAPPLPLPPEAMGSCARQQAAPLPRLSSVPSLSSPSIEVKTTAETNNSARGGGEAEDDGDLELLDASEMEGAIDALLGEGILEAFGEEVSGAEDMLPLLTGVFGDG